MPLMTLLKMQTEIRKHTGVGLTFACYFSHCETSTEMCLVQNNNFMAGEAHSCQPGLSADMQHP